MRSLLLASAAMLALIGPSQAQKGIFTGGPNGAYFKTFCPPLPEALKNAQFTGYACTVSGGSIDNITNVIDKPTSIGFVQFDVFAREEAKRPEIVPKLTVIRQLACEGLWMFTKNPRLKDYGDVLGLARRLPFIVAEGGSKSTFEFVQSIDPDGLGRARNVKYAKDATAVINEIAASPDGGVGMFVQFADPENPNIQLMMEKGLTIIPVVSRELLQAKVGAQDVYQIQTFSLSTGMFSGKTATTACTPVTIITGSPDLFSDRNDKDNQSDLIKEIQTLPDAALLPKESRIAKLITSAKRVSGKALDEALGAVEAARKKMEQSQ